jgi:hypothetical protein
MYPYPSTMLHRLLGRTAAMTSHVTVVLLLVGSIGLLKWQAWSRRVLVGWAILRIIAVILVSTNYLVAFHALRSATTQVAVSPTMTYYTLISLGSAMMAIAFPAIVLGVLMQREIADLWAREKRGGFEVIPLAKVADSPAGGNVSTP